MKWYTNRLSFTPLLISILLALITILFMVFAGVIIVIREASGIEAIIVQGIFIWISALLGIFMMKISDQSLAEYGLQFSKKWSSRKMLWFIPLILVEVIPFFSGINSDLTVGIFIVLILFVLGVGVNEEVFYRGLILKVLQVNGIKYSIIVSSVIFGVAHGFNALSGQNLTYIVLQIIFAGLFGFVCAEIVILTRSLIFPILWHSTHDLIALSTTQTFNNLSLVILGLQTFCLVLYSIYLWRKIGNEDLINFNKQEKLTENMWV